MTANPEGAKHMSTNTIPGATDLGWGFNIFGPYSDTSRKSQLFELTAAAPWKDPRTGTEYGIPGNVSLSTIGNSGANSYAFQNRSQVQEFFAQKAGVSANLVTEFGAFSGAFNASYQNGLESDTFYQYVLYEADNTAWSLDLQSQSYDDLTARVKQEISQLPNAFSPESKASFFRFFDRYGTHYVSRVNVGGRLYYYAAVKKSYQSDLEKIKAEITLEYNALLVSGKAESETEWSSLSKSWTENRVVQIEAIGGSPDILKLASPEYGENQSGAYSQWLQSIQAAPATVDFVIRPIDYLFPNEKIEAVKQATEAYFSENILSVEVRSVVVPFPEPKKPSNLPVITLGSQIEPDVPPLHDFGFQLVVMQPLESDYEVLLNKYYSIDLYQAEQKYGAIFDGMYQDLFQGGFTRSGYIVVLGSYNWYWQAPPTGDFVRFLVSAGAGSLLQGWIDGAITPGSISNEDAAYILVGLTGSGANRGAESLAKAAVSGGPIRTAVTVRLNGLEIQRISPPAARKKEAAT
jgi:hypothetical protein